MTYAITIKYADGSIERRDHTGPIGALIDGIKGEQAFSLTAMVRA